MSDQWIFSPRNFMYGTFLAAEIMKTIVLPVELSSQGDLSWVAPQQELIQRLPLQDYHDLAGQVRDSERQTRQQDQEVARNAPPDRPDGAWQPPAEESPLKKLNEGLDDLEEGIEKLTKTEEQDPRETAELLATRQEELEALLARQKKEYDEKTKEMAGYREEMATRYADSPLQQERHLANFDKAAESVVTAMAGRHDSQLRNFEERWQQKEKQPEIMPVDPGRNHR